MLFKANTLFINALEADRSLAEVQRDALVAIRKLPQYKTRKIGVKMAVYLAGPFILSFQKEAAGEEAADSEKSKSD